MVRRQLHNIYKTKMLAGLLIGGVFLFWGTPLWAGGGVQSGFSLDDESLQDLFPTWDHSRPAAEIQSRPLQVMPSHMAPMPMPPYTVPAGPSAVQASPAPPEPQYVYPPVPLKPAPQWTSPAPSGYPVISAEGSQYAPIHGAPVQPLPNTGVAGQANVEGDKAGQKAADPVPKTPPAAKKAVQPPPAPEKAAASSSADSPPITPAAGTSARQTAPPKAPEKRVNVESDLVITENGGHTIYQLTEASMHAVASSDFFTLEDCLAIALEVNPNMINAAWSVKGAEWEKKKAAGDFLPSARLQYTYSLLDETPTSTSQGRTVVVGHQENYSAETTISQPIFTGFALLSQYELARLGLNTAEIQKCQARLDLILETKQYYYLLLQARKSLEVARQSVQQLEAHLKDAEHYYEVGLVPKIQYLEAQLKLAQAVQNQTVAENDVAYACARMNTLLRRPLDAPIEVLDLTSPGPSVFQLNDCLAEALLRRPEILVAEQRIQASDQQIRLANSGFYPNVSLAYKYEKDGDAWDVNGSKYSESSSWNVAAQADWTIWDWGRTYKDVQVKKTERHKAYTTLDQVKEIVVLEVKKNYLALESATRNIDVSQKAMDQAEENFRLNNERYQAQIATSTEVTDAQTLLTQAKINYYNALYQMALAKAALERAMGIEEVDS